MKTRLNYLTSKENINRIGLVAWRYFYDTYREDCTKLGMSVPLYAGLTQEEEKAQYGMLVEKLQCISMESGVSEQFAEALQTLEQLAEHDRAEMRQFIERSNEEFGLEAYFFEQYPAQEGQVLSHLELALVMLCHPQGYWIRLVGYMTYMVQDRSVMNNYALTDEHIETVAPQEIDLDELKKEFKQELQWLFNQPVKYCEVDRFELSDEEESGAQEYCFTLAHADRPIRRNRVVGDTVESFIYNPPAKEIVVYNTRTRNLRMNTDLVGMSKVVTGIFSRLLTARAHEQVFEKTNVYTFEPIEAGKPYLDTRDIPGLKWVKLHMLEVQEHDDDGQLCIHAYRGAPGGDIKKSVGYGDALPQGSVRKVAFELLFEGDRRATKIRISSPYSITITKHRRYWAERWLKKAGFVLKKMS